MAVHGTYNITVGEIKIWTVDQKPKCLDFFSILYHHAHCKPYNTYAFFLIVETDALEGDYIICLSVLGLVHDTVCAYNRENQR